MKLLGGILLIIGTAIGGGMLALPIATSSLGFVYSSSLLFFCWFMMTTSAFLILEVNMWLPANSNIISMAKATLGRKGELVAWTTYLLLLYSLLAAYIAGGGDFIKNLLNIIHITPPDWLMLVLFTLILGYVVYHGIKSVDIVNRFLMFAKLGSFIILSSFVIPHVSLPKLAEGQFHSIAGSITVAMTSFGFATIIPSLRTYFHDDIKKLRFAIIVGSLIPLVCYIIWDLAIMGVIPRTGDHGLISMLHSNRSTSEFVNELSNLLQRDTITTFARIFTTVCLLTSFLGVSLCLADFLTDGLRVAKTSKNKLIVHGLTFLPPLFIVLFYPGAFITALSYAGICCILLLALLPALMAWYGRYHKKIPQTGYRVIGGKVTLILVITLSVLIIIQNMFNVF